MGGIPVNPFNLRCNCLLYTSLGGKRLAEADDENIYIPEKADYNKKVMNFIQTYVCLLYTSFYSTRKYPTYLLFNPYFEAKVVTLNQHFTEPTDLYDLVSQKYIKKNCTGETSIILNPDNACLLYTSS